MRKLVSMIVAALLVMALPFTSAAAEPDSTRGVDEPGTGIEQPDVKEVNQGTGLGNNTPTDTMQNGSGEGRGMPENIAALREQMQERAQQMMDNASAMGQQMRNQNQVRATIESLHMMDEYVGGYGEQVREVAREMNNSFERAYEAEQNMERRGGFARFFVGGDDEAAQEIEEAVNMTQDRVNELRQVREDCDCPDDVKLMLEEQIQNLESEENRLRARAKQEQKKNGLFGWLLG